MVTIHFWSLLGLLFILGNALAEENDAKNELAEDNLKSTVSRRRPAPTYPSLARRHFSIGFGAGVLGTSAYQDYKQMKRERKYGVQSIYGPQMGYGGMYGAQPQMPYGQMPIGIQPQMPYGQMPYGPQSQMPYGSMYGPQPPMPYGPQPPMPCGPQPPMPYGPQPPMPYGPQPPMPYGAQPPMPYGMGGNGMMGGYGMGGNGMGGNGMMGGYGMGMNGMGMNGMGMNGMMGGPIG